MKHDTDSHWRRTARSIIQKVIKTHPELATREDLPALFKLVSKAYPWGERKMHPYKMWCKEVGLARNRLQHVLGFDKCNALYAKCDACGSRAGIPCKPVGAVLDELMVAQDAELEGRLEDAAKIRRNAFHEARLIAVGLALPNDTLPLLFMETT